MVQVGIRSGRSALSLFIARDTSVEVACYFWSDLPFAHGLCLLARRDGFDGRRIEQPARLALLYSRNLLRFHLFADRLVSLLAIGRAQLGCLLYRRGLNRRGAFLLFHFK